MKAGIVKFVGERLTEALEIRTISKVALAELIEVTPDAISKWERCQSSPMPEKFGRLCNVLNLPPEFFYRPVPKPASDLQPTATFFRCLVSASEGARKKAQRRIEWVHEAFQYLSSYVKFPVLNLPDTRLPSSYRDITSDHIERAALEVRRVWNLGLAPVSNVTWLLENNGVVIRCNTIFDDSIDAYSRFFSESNTAIVLLAEDKRSAVRSRWDAAHELGHLLMHRSVTNEILKKRSEHKIIEEQANRFAAAFLLPTESFLRDLGPFMTLNTFISLKAKWKVSVRAMIMRSGNLGLLTKEEQRHLFISANKRWGAKNEPLDNELPSEVPCLLKDALLALVESGEQAKPDICMCLPYGAQDLSFLFGVEEFFFCNAPPVASIVDISTWTQR